MPAAGRSLLYADWPVSTACALLLRRRATSKSCRAMPSCVFAYGALRSWQQPVTTVNASLNMHCMLQPTKRASQRVLVLRHERQYSNMPKARFTTSFNASRPSSLLKTQIESAFYTRSHSRRIASTSRQHASLASFSSSQTPSTFPIQTHGIPLANEPLHAALSELNNLTPDLVDQSRLQLALRGLESTSPTVRIAILGAGENSLGKAKRLARLLIADPLDQEKAWERQLKGNEDGDNRAILLRYSELEGEDGFGGVHGAAENPLLKTITARSLLLGREKVELFVGQASIDYPPWGDTSGEYDGQSRLRAAVLPVLHDPLAGSGRAGSVRFPVHRTIMLGESLRGAVNLSAYMSLHGEHCEGPVHIAVDLPVSDSALEGTSTNIAAAEDALEAFRTDVRNGPRFSEIWQTSGMSRLTELLKSHRGGQLPEPVKEHIHSVLSTTKDTLTSTVREAERDIRSTTVPDTIRHVLQAAITSWSEYAHSDLRDTMTMAFESSTWRRTSFPRLLWRVDDVSFSAAELLHSNFLTESETYLAFLTGRIGEAGFFAKSQTSSSSQSSPPPARVASPASDIDPQQGLSPVQFLQLSQTRDKIKAETGIDPFVTKPWPAGLTACRHSLLTTLVPSLHVRGQSLVLQCLGLIGSTSALGTWYIVATAGSGMYEAGAIVGLGVVWALRRLQKLWGAERSKFESEVREQGRIALGEVEARLRGIVRDGRRPQIIEEDQERWNKAEEVIHRCRELLHKF